MTHPVCPSMNTVSTKKKMGKKVTTFAHCLRSYQTLHSSMHRDFELGMFGARGE